MKHCVRNSSDNDAVVRRAISSNLVCHFSGSIPVKIKSSTCVGRGASGKASSRSGFHFALPRHALVSPSCDDEGAPPNDAAISTNCLVMSCKGRSRFLQGSDRFCVINHSILSMKAPNVKNSIAQLRLLVPSFPSFLCVDASVSYPPVEYSSAASVPLYSFAASTPHSPPGRSPTT
ncbi:hypothetical protein GOBAR_AA38796 [Gossypium barbadense]|uniref:Uncharacterized protein n=1 Tax=Gossypium barbadense TaxID=3634 RepID=A0A2P5VSY9_GOSBA|nr:hypothetical protein GOBAR_AA38796 [Gossypium barbadense]